MQDSCLQLPPNTLQQAILKKSIVGPCVAFGEFGKGVGIRVISCRKVRAILRCQSLRATTSWWHCERLRDWPLSLPIVCQEAEMLPKHVGKSVHSVVNLSGCFALVRPIEFLLSFSCRCRHPRSARRYVRSLCSSSQSRALRAR